MIYRMVANKSKSKLMLMFYNEYKYQGLHFTFTKEDANRKGEIITSHFSTQMYQNKEKEKVLI